MGQAVDAAAAAFVNTVGASKAAFPPFEGNRNEVPKDVIVIAEGLARTALKCLASDCYVNAGVSSRKRVDETHCFDRRCLRRTRI